MKPPSVSLCGVYIPWYMLSLGYQFAGTNIGATVSSHPCLSLSCFVCSHTLQGINISHLGKRKIIFKMPFWGDMLVPWRVAMSKFTALFNRLATVYHRLSTRSFLINTLWCLLQAICLKSRSKQKLLEQSAGTLNQHQHHQHQHQRKNKKTMHIDTKKQFTNQLPTTHPTSCNKLIPSWSKRLSFSPPCPRVQSDPVRHPSRILRSSVGSQGWLPFKWWLSRKANGIWNELKDMVSMASKNANVN